MENQYSVIITEIEQLTHNVKCFKTMKPEGYRFKPGQATEVAISTEKLRNEKRPFTFTSLNEWNYIEFIIKVYDEHDGVTKQLGKLKPGDELLIGEPWGVLTFQQPGTFIAGGTGITPFLAILRDLYSRQKQHGIRLLLSNRKYEDIIMEKELSAMLGNNFINTLADEKREGYEYGRIDFDFLKKHVLNREGHFYICGPDPMVESIKGSLQLMEIPESSIIIEK